MVQDRNNLRGIGRTELNTLQIYRQDYKLTLLTSIYIAYCNYTFAMAIKKECPEKYDWWLNELESLGVSVKVLNDLNNIQEVSELTENLKQTFYQEYKTTYSK